MGEAKRRKQVDLDYGRISNSELPRGLVISCPIEIEGTSLHLKSPNLDAQELRFALLFWDRLVWPISSVLHVGGDLNAEFLEGEGILSRLRYGIEGDVAQGMAQVQIRAFLERERAEPGLWALAQGENSFLLKEGFVEGGAGASVELHHAIPIPKHDVPLAEILEFKQRRRDELVRLRSHLEAFVSEIQESPDRAAALDKFVGEIDKDCADLLKVGREWQCPVFLSDLKVCFSLTASKLLPAGAGHSVSHSG